MEDCEYLLHSREQGGNGLISSLLNLSDGILGDSLNIKFLCTFNADLRQIDKALLRKGRLKIKYELKELSVDKTNVLLQRLGHEPQTKALPLCEIYNYDVDIWSPMIIYYIFVESIIALVVRWIFDIK